MIPSTVRISLVAMLTVGALAVWGCGGTTISGGDQSAPTGAETVALHVEGMT